MDSKVENSEEPLEDNLEDNVEDYLDYDRWFACIECGREVVPCQDADPDELICGWCADDILLNDADDDILIYGE